MLALDAIRADADDAASVFGLSDGSISRRIAAAAAQAGLGEGYSGHSCRVGMARDLAAAGIDLASLMLAGRWSSSAMPSRYIRNEDAARGAVARYYAAAA